MSAVPFVVRESEEDGSVLVHVVCEVSILEDVDLLLKHALHMHQVRDRLPGPLRTVRLTPSSSKYRVEFVFEKREEWNSEFFQAFEFMADFTLCQEAKLIFRNKGNEV